MSVADSSILDYEALVADFNQTLVTRLRGHGLGPACLEMWVPDEDPVKSILNMTEAAAAYGEDKIAILVRPSTLSEKQVESLLEQLSRIGSVAIEPNADGRVFSISNLAR